MVVRWILSGAGGGARTHKDFTPADFKSAASANSATPAEAKTHRIVDIRAEVGVKMALFF